MNHAGCFVPVAVYSWYWWYPKAMRIRKTRHVCLNGVARWSNCKHDVDSHKSTTKRDRTATAGFGIVPPNLASGRNKTRL